jgi:hypothetical protein
MSKIEKPNKVSKKRIVLADLGHNALKNKKLSFYL